MSWTKRQIVEEAFAELSLQGYAFDLSAEEQQGAARRLEMMLAQWSGHGVRIGYAFAADQQSIDLDAASGVPLSAIHAVVANLACTQAASYGKTLKAQTVLDAREGFAALLGAAVMPAPSQLPGTLPRGAGSRLPVGMGSTYLTQPDDGPLSIAADGGLTFGGA